MVTGKGGEVVRDLSDCWFAVEIVLSLDKGDEKQEEEGQMVG